MMDNEEGEGGGYICDGGRIGILHKKLASANTLCRKSAENVGKFPENAEKVLTKGRFWSIIYAVSRG